MKKDGVWGTLLASMNARTTSMSLSLSGTTGESLSRHLPSCVLQSNGDRRIGVTVRRQKIFLE